MHICRSITRIQCIKYRQFNAQRIQKGIGVKNYKKNERWKTENQLRIVGISRVGNRDRYRYIHRCVYTEITLYFCHHHSHPMQWHCRCVDSMYSGFVSLNTLSAVFRPSCIPFYSIPFHSVLFCIIKRRCSMHNCYLPMTVSYAVEIRVITHSYSHSRISPSFHNQLNSIFVSVFLSISEAAQLADSK